MPSLVFHEVTKFKGEQIFQNTLSENWSIPVRKFFIKPSPNFYQ